MPVLEGAVAPCRQLAVYVGLSNDLPIDNYRRCALFAWEVCSCTIYDLWALRYRKVDKSTIDIA